MRNSPDGFLILEQMKALLAEVVRILGDAEDS